MSAQHTPTPWNCHGGTIYAEPIVPGSTGEIARCFENEVEDLGFDLVDAPLPAESNAAFIVRAVNAHDELVAALREMTLCFGAGPASEEWWEAEHDRRGPGGDGMSSKQIRNAITERASAALAKAGAL